MENGPAQDYLQVPITERERVQHQHQRHRSRSNERLIPENESLYSQSVYSQPFEDDRPDTISPGPSRFPSVRGGPSNYYADQQPRRFHSYQGGGQQYAAISPIDEEDIVDNDGAASDVPSSLRPRTIPQSEKSFEPLVPLPDLWTPIWLKRSTLLAFIIFFIISIIALIVLWVLSATRSGFEIHFSGPHHEYWVYFPTILVISFTGLWRQVDYHTKSLTPWDELQRGPVDAQKSLLLDYVSPLQVVALFTAFVQNHIPIVATVSAFVGFKVITVFSTGLFILLPQDVEQDGFPFEVTARFDGSGVGDLQDVTAAPVSAFYGTAYQGIPQAVGVWENLAYAPFRYDPSRNEKLAENATFRAEVDAFVPVITCRAVEADLDGNGTVTQSASGDVYGAGIRFSLPDDDICSNWAAVAIPALNPEQQIAPDEQVYGSALNLTCGDDNDAGAILFSVLDLSFEQELRPGSTELALAGEPVATSSSRTVNSMSNVLCQASHTISRVKVTNNTLEPDSPTQGVTLQLANNAQNRTLDGLSDGSLVAALQALISASGEIFGQTLGTDDTSGFFSLLAMHLGSRDVSRLLQTNDLISAAETTLTGIMAQYAHQSLSQAANDEITGRAVRRETRYTVNEASAAVMIGALVIGAVAGIVLFLNAPRGVVPRNPGPIAASAATLTNSIELNRLLRRGGIPSENNSEVALNGYEFGTAIATTEHGQASFKIVTSEGIRDHNAPKPDNSLRWWHPITSSIFFVGFTVALPIVCIGLLEFIQSKNEDGIVTVPDNLATDIYTHYIPSLVMVITASMVNLIDFNVLVFTPWSELAKGAATHKKSILAYYLGLTPLEAIYKALRVRQMNVAVSSLATIVASILAIVAAGLYNGDRFDTAGTTIRLVQSDEFNLEWANSATSDNGAAGIVSSILHNNLSYPAFTYRHLVFPSFDLENGDLTTVNGTFRETTTNLTQINMDALQADLQCYLVDRNFITVNVLNTSIDVEILASLPDNCQIGGADSDSSFISFTTSFDLPAEGDLIAGRQNDLLLGDGSAFIGNVLDNKQQNLSSLIGDNPAIGCPSLAFTYASLSSSDNSSSTDGITSMLCYQRIMSVHSTFHLVSNTTIIDTRLGVTVDQSDSTLLTNPLSNASLTDDADKVFDFRIQDDLLRGFRPFTSTTGEGLDLDPFFQGVINAEGPIGPSSLIGEENQTALLTAILDFYRLYMAQAISLNMRSPLSTNNSSLSTRQNTGTPLATIPTTLTTIRLVQDPTTKLILQILLGLTALLTLLGWSLIRFHRVLPLPPTSIANSMSLLAGSDLAHTDESDEGLCECCGKRRRDSFDGAHRDADGRPVSSRSERAERGRPDARLSVPEGVEFDTRSASPKGTREGVIPPGAEWWDADAGSSATRDIRRDRARKNEKARWEVVFAGRRYSMGWWRENTAKGRMRRRWGVDVGERPDGGVGTGLEEEWMLGRRRLRVSSEGGVGMRFEGVPQQQQQGRERAGSAVGLGVERAYGGEGYGPVATGALQPRPSSDLGYSANRSYPAAAGENPFADPRGSTGSNLYVPPPPQQAASPQPQGEAWSLGARRLRESQDVTPSMRFEPRQQQQQQEPIELLSPTTGITRGRALDVPPTPGWGGYGEGGLRGEESTERGGGRGIASSDRGDESEEEDDEHEGDLGRQTNFSRGGYRRVEGGEA